MLNWPEMFWLYVMNFVLGAATLVCLIAIVTAVTRELTSRSLGRDGPLTRRLRSISLRQLGFESTDTEELPDEKDLHPGMIPDEESKNETHSE